MTKSNASHKSEPDVTADDLRRWVDLFGLVPIPDHLMDDVLGRVRAYRAAMRRFDEAGIDIAETMSAHPFEV